MQILPSNLLLFLLASAYISYTSARTETKKEISPTNSSTTIDNDQTVPKPKKNMPIPGGPIPKDPNSDEIKEIVDRAMVKLNAQSNDAVYLVPIEIISAESQVVAGVKYTIQIRVGKTSCLKNQVSLAQVSSENCSSKATDPKVYNVTVWQKSWENFEQITFDLPADQPEIDKSVVQ